METDKRQSEGREADILFSRTVKAGQRIYYIDVKRNRRGEMYLCITESKKMLSGPQDMPGVSYEKHKVFLFPEDFGKFNEALADAFSFIGSEGGEKPGRTDGEEAIKLDLDF